LRAAEVGFNDSTVMGLAQIRLADITVTTRAIPSLLGPRQCRGNIRVVRSVSTTGPSWVMRDPGFTRPASSLQSGPCISADKGALSAHHARTDRRHLDLAGAGKRPPPILWTQGSGPPIVRPVRSQRDGGTRRGTRLFIAGSDESRSVHWPDRPNRQILV
jgi:hypothetical protein